MKAISQTVQYKNPQLALRIQKTLRCSRREALAVQNDLIHWLWLCGRHKELAEKQPSLLRKLPDLRMLDHFRAIDFAWHEFILMTKDYEAFCETYLGRFVHHTPGPLERTLERKHGGRIAGKTYLKNYLSFIYDEVGEARFDRWMNVLPQMKVPE